MTDVETEKENSTQKYFFHKIYDKYLNLNQIFNRKKVFKYQADRKKMKKKIFFCVHSFQTQIFSAKFKLPCSKYYVCNSSRIVRQTLAKILRGQKLHQSFFLHTQGFFFSFWKNTEDTFCFFFYFSDRR